MGVETLDFGFATPKRHFFTRNRVVWRILRQNRCTRLGCSLSQVHPPKSSRVNRGAKSRMRRTETPKPIWIQFCTLVDIPDIVIYTNFGDHRLRGFWVTGVKFPPLPLTSIIALTTLSHYRVSVWYRMRDAGEWVSKELEKVTEKLSVDRKVR